MIDIIEQEIASMSEGLFDVLLKDRTTKKNICWATDHYISRGSAYYPQEPITKELVTGSNTKLVQPRVAKSHEIQSKRTKEKAEVFTPSWVCNELKLPTGKTCTFPIVIHLSATSIIKPQTFVVHYAYIPVVC